MAKIQVATYQTKAKELITQLGTYTKDVVVRLGGTMPYKDYPIQINSSAAVKDSVNKLTQKVLMINADLKTLPLLPRPTYPCVIKGIVRSCGNGVFVVRNVAEFNAAADKLKQKFIVEPLFKATSEYRLHCTKDKVFFAVKKKKFNDEDIIITSKNHSNVREFTKPRLWEQIKTECIKAMNVLDLDIACFDVMYSSAGEHTFVIAEGNTNPELLTHTFDAYKAVLAELIVKKINERRQATPMEELDSLNVTQEQLLAAVKQLPAAELKKIVNKLKQA